MYKYIYCNKSLSSKTGKPMRLETCLVPDKRDVYQTNFPSLLPFVIQTVNIWRSKQKLPFFITR